MGVRPRSIRGANAHPNGIFDLKLVFVPTLPGRLRFKSRQDLPKIRRSHDRHPIKTPNTHPYSHSTQKQGQGVCPGGTQVSGPPRGSPWARCVSKRRPQKPCEPLRLERWGNIPRPNRSPRDRSRGRCWIFPSPVSWRFRETVESVACAGFRRGSTGWCPSGKQPTD